jgi:hypothetical protein
MVEMPRKINGQYIKFAQKPMTRVFDWYIQNGDVTITPELEVLPESVLEHVVLMANQARDSYMSHTAGTDKDWSRHRKIELKRQVQSEILETYKESINTLYAQAGVKRGKVKEANLSIIQTPAQLEKDPAVVEMVSGQKMDLEMDEFEDAVAFLTKEDTKAALLLKEDNDDLAEFDNHQGLDFEIET